MRNIGVIFPTIVPTVIIKEIFEKLLTVKMFDMAHAGDKAVEVLVGSGGDLVGSAVTVAANAFAGDDESGVDDGTGKGDAFGDGLLVLFLGV